jgi:hypothetical protein
MLLLAALLRGIGTEDGSDGRMSNVNMGAGSGSRHRAPKGDKWNSHLPQVGEQRSAFGAVRMERDVHCVSMIEPEPIMGHRLAKGRDW